MSSKACTVLALSERKQPGLGLPDEVRSCCCSWMISQCQTLLRRSIEYTLEVQGLDGYRTVEIPNNINVSVRICLLVLQVAATFKENFLFAMAAPLPVAPNVKDRVLQQSADSTYTRNKVSKNIYICANVSAENILCSPVFIPQMVGGFGPSEFETLKVSVRHWVNWLTSTVPAGATTPDFANRFVTDTVLVLGPEIEKDWKSSRSCNIYESEKELARIRL